MEFFQILPNFFQISSKFLPNFFQISSKFLDDRLAHTLLNDFTKARDSLKLAMGNEKIKRSTHDAVGEEIVESVERIDINFGCVLHFVAS